MTNKGAGRITGSRFEWFALVRAVVFFFLMVQAARLGLYLASWPAPIRYATLVLLLLLPWLGWRSIRALIHWGQGLDPTRTAVSLLVIFTLIVFFAGMNNPSPRGPLESFADAAVMVLRQPIGFIERAYQAALRFPGDIWMAYTRGGGRAGQIQPKPANEMPLPVIDIPAASSKDIAKVELGEQTILTAQATTSCILNPLSPRPFAPETRVTVIEGPRMKAGNRWWRVQSDSTVGWCPSDVLSSTAK